MRGGQPDFRGRENAGALKACTTRAAKFYDITYDHEARSLSWIRGEDACDAARQLHGCYHLCTSLDMSDQALWKLYMILTRAEGSFRMMKSELGLRPFQHQIEKRRRGHTWLKILAYYLLRWVEHTLGLSGYHAM